MSHIDRKKEIAIGALPPKDTEAYKKITNYLEKSETPDLAEFKKKNWEKVTSSLNAQYSSSCGLLTEKNLRHFLLEFNNRVWKNGLWSMPTMFNVMESFFNYKKPEVYFELIEEENYYVSLLNFLDFVTSDRFIMDKDILEENIAENIIYNFEVNKHSENLTFKNSNDHIFIIKGISIIRRENEITLSIIAGKRKTDEDSLDFGDYKELENSNPNKEKIVQQIKEDLNAKDLEFEYLDVELV